MKGDQVSYVSRSADTTDPPTTADPLTTSNPLTTGNPPTTPNTTIPSTSPCTDDPKQYIVELPRENCQSVGSIGIWYMLATSLCWTPLYAWQYLSWAVGICSVCSWQGGGRGTFPIIATSKSLFGGASRFEICWYMCKGWSWPLRDRLDWLLKSLWILVW